MLTLPFSNTSGGEVIHWILAEKKNLANSSEISVDMKTSATLATACTRSHTSEISPMSDVKGG